MTVDHMDSISKIKRLKNKKKEWITLYGKRTQEKEHEFSQTLIRIKKQSIICMNQHGYILHSILNYKALNTNVYKQTKYKKGIKAI